ncbi:MAG: hypothetical protein J2P57_15615 [Acidimicrobiaceae bacterium]|nr:hypothetical protein [Acidimicrobiaceae bacterium]
MTDDAQAEGDRQREQLVASLGLQRHYVDGTFVESADGETFVDLLEKKG